MPTNEYTQVVCRLTQEAYDQLRLLGQESPETYLGACAAEAHYG